MELKEILKRHAVHRSKSPSWSCQNTISTANSSSVSRLINQLPINILQMIRSLHLELTLENATQGSQEALLYDNIESNISLVTSASHSTLNHDRSIDQGFKEQKKMRGLLEILKWFAKSEISEEELYILIDQWHNNYGVTQQLSTQSSSLINEVFTFFLILEQDRDFKDKLLNKVPYNSA